MEIEFRIEEADIDAFLDHHSQYSGALREIRRRQRYGYGILFVIFGLMFWAFGETAVAIAFLVLGPAWAAWWPTRARRLARQQAAPFYPTGANPDFDGPHVLRLDDAGLFHVAPGTETRTSYASIQHVEVTPDQLLVYTSPVRAIVVPSRRVSTGDVDSFVRELRVRIGEPR